MGKEWGKLCASVVWCGLSLGFSAPAEAVRAPDKAATFEVFSGKPPRDNVRTASVSPNARAQTRWRSANTILDGSWQVLWDADTHVPLRITGPGIAAPGTVNSAAAASTFARDLLPKLLPLLAPGAGEKDFVLAGNDLSDGIRTVGFFQQHDGLPVLGGQISFRFKNDRLIVIASEALPNVRTTGSGAATVILPIIHPAVGNTVSIDFHRATTVTSEEPDALGRWQVYLDPQSRKPIARAQLLRFAKGILLYNAPERWPGGARKDYPAAFMSLSQGGATTAAGEVSLNSSTFNASVSGPYANVKNQGGTAATRAMSLVDGAIMTWMPDDELEDAQLTTFIHGPPRQGVRAHPQQKPGLAEPTDSGHGQHQRQLQRLVRRQLHQFLPCERTVRQHRPARRRHLSRVRPLAAQSIDYPGRRQLRQRFQRRAVRLFRGDHRERFGDGPGFLQNLAAASPDRSGRPRIRLAGRRRRSPRHRPDLCRRHVGLAEIAGSPPRRSSWRETRQSPVLRGGPARFQLPATYAEIIAADDDDGNLDNGTPNGCAIRYHFARHGLAEAFPTDPGMTGPELTGLEVFLPNALPEAIECGLPVITASSVEWRLRGSETTEVLPMTAIAGGFSARLPNPAPNQVLEYRVRVVYDIGSEDVFPQNPADPFYQVFIGNLVPIACTSFEGDPAEAGWSYSGSWEWGAPEAVGGDPALAHSGDALFGTGLGGKGTYSPNQLSRAAMPSIDVGDYQNIHLQFYRWLATEDAQFDQASIRAGGALLWQNADSPGNSLHHRDTEWVFRDVDLSDAVENRAVAPRFELSSDGGVELGGWNLDDVCVVAAVDGPCDPATGCRCAHCSNGTCGNAVVDNGEACDDGNGIDGDGCSNLCVVDGDAAGGGCNAGGAPALWVIALFWLRRRRRYGSRSQIAE